MESHYKDSLSTAIVNILLQCGFENSSKRALDEFIGLSLNYVKNISSKISSLTSDCNMPESDILIGLGALKLHGENLDELFNFLHNYNEIFPPQPKIYFGPIPVKHAQKPHEERPLDIVSWAPEMSPALATIGLKLKNNQIVTDPNFDRSKFLALSFKPLSITNDNSKTNNSLSQSQTMTNSKVKYGSSCSYHLPPEAYPNKYEPPTIDLDSNGAVIGLNGRSGKLPDPYINDLEEQDILRQKSKFNENHSTKMTFHNQLFNGVRRKQRPDTVEEPAQSSPIIKRKVRPETPPVTEHYKSNHVEKSVTSDDAWNAALQATVTTLVKPDPYALIIDSPNHSPLKPLTPLIKKHKKRHRSPSQQRAKKKRRLDDRPEEDVSQIYQNESTMDSRVSNDDDHVPYSSSPDRHSSYNYLNNYQTSQGKEKSPSYSPINDAVPNSIPHHTGSHFTYAAEILPSQSFLPTSKSKKKKSTRKTHFTNKRKKKPLTAAIGTNCFQYQADQMDLPDNLSVLQRIPTHHIYTARSPSPAVSLTDQFCVAAADDDSDDDGTEPMRESSEEMLKMLEIEDSNLHNYDHESGSVMDSPLLNNKHNHVQENSSEGGIRMRIKLCKTNSDTNRGGSYVNSITDLSSPPQSQQHSEDDKNSISERLNFMRDESPYDHSAFAKSPVDQPYYSRDSVSVASSVQDSYHHIHGDRYPPLNSITSDVLSSTVSKSNTPIKFSTKSLELLRHHHSASSHSSPKTLPALDDCDSKIPSLSFKTSAKSTAKKRKRSRPNSSSKKSKSKKSSKQKVDSDVPTPKPIEKNFISVDDVFSEDEEEPVKVEHQNHVSSPLPLTPIAQVHCYDQPHTLDIASPYRLPIPIMKINNKSISKRSTTKSSSKKSKTLSVPPSPIILKPLEPKMMYNYSCLQGEAHYQSEDGKVVYICPICNTEDNGSLMLQCDLCEDWYHGLCLGIFEEPPDDQQWYCPRCKEDRAVGRANPSKPKTSKNRSKRK